MANELENQAVSEMTAETTTTEFEVLQKTIAALAPLPAEARRRILESVSLFLQVPARPTSPHSLPQATDSTFLSASSRAPFSEDTSMSPKDFLLEKSPKTDVERIACLAYYLTHYRATPHFKTIDLSMLNTEAAQPKFANAAYSSNNAVKLGYLVPSTKGRRQLSAIGERFVRALPDREAAKAALDANRRKPRGKRPKPRLAAKES